VAYLCGVLNTELLDLWYALRGKTPRDIWRNYEPKRMNEMPYRPPDGDPRAEEVAGLVRQIAENRRALLPHRKVFKGLDRVVKDPWRTGPVALDEAALVAELPPAETISVRLASQIELTLSEPGRARVSRTQPNELELRRGRARAGSLRGEPQWLDLLEQVLDGQADERIGETLLPKDLGRFRDLAHSRRVLVDDLLNEGRRLVEEVERLVCAIYEVPPDLTDDVVAHAVTRAGTTSSVG
jgi:hypothetical protein